MCIRDSAYRVRGETLGAFDGVVGSGATLRPLPTAVEAADGKLWFATTGGIYGIDPARRPHNRVPPPVLIPVSYTHLDVYKRQWPGIPVVPALEPGASDAQFLNPAGIPTYGVTGIFTDPDGGHIHGLNERVRVQSVYEGRKFLYRLVKLLSLIHI